jgi:hypothetical protein
LEGRQRNKSYSPKKKNKKQQQQQQPKSYNTESSRLACFPFLLFSYFCDFLGEAKQQQSFFSPVKRDVVEPKTKLKNKAKARKGNKQTSEGTNKMGRSI